MISVMFYGIIWLKYSIVLKINTKIVLHCQHHQNEVFLKENALNALSKRIGAISNFSYFHPVHLLIIVEIIKFKSGLFY